MIGLLFRNFWMMIRPIDDVFIDFCNYHKIEGTFAGTCCGDLDLAL